MNKIEITMLPEEYQETAELIGVESFMELCHHFGGTNLYIPKPDRVVRHVRDNQIKKEFNGGNYKELSKKYRLSESYVRKIVGNPSDNIGFEQTSIFEFLGEAE